MPLIDADSSYGEAPAFARGASFYKDKVPTDPTTTSHLLLCYNCGGHGHLCRHCPNPPRASLIQATTTQPPLLCYNCGVRGHLCRHCPVSRRASLILNDPQHPLMSTICGGRHSDEQCPHFTNTQVQPCSPTSTHQRAPTTNTAQPPRPSGVLSTVFFDKELSMPLFEDSKIDQTTSVLMESTPHGAKLPDQVVGNPDLKRDFILVANSSRVANHSRLFANSVEASCDQRSG